MELSRPGRAGVLDRLRVKRLDVHKLLVGMRERYPELESYLDPERVASWEGAGGSGETVPSVVRWIFILVLVGSLLARLGGNLASGDSDGPPSDEQISEALIDAQLGIAAPEVFGPGTDLAALRKSDPVFVNQWRLATGQGSNTDAALAFVRARAAAAGEVAAFEQLVIRADLRAMWMRAAFAQSPEVCRNIMVGDFDSVPLQLGNKERAREQALLRQLLDAKLLSHRATKRSVSASVPGWAIEKMMKRSELRIDELTAALKDPEHPKRCLVDLTMAEVVLAEPGRVSIELLRAL
ncbi:MAG: hypothetical protein C0472_00010 [Erythrobacter sp.]|nr:hypothetical protein [Erythrobacter sp.]